MSIEKSAKPGQYVHQDNLSQDEVGQDKTSQDKMSVRTKRLLATITLPPTGQAGRKQLPSVLKCGPARYHHHHCDHTSGHQKLQHHHQCF